MVSSITNKPVVAPFGSNGLSIRYKRIKGDNLEANIYLGRGHDKIELKVFEIEKALKDAMKF